MKITTAKQALINQVCAEKYLGQNLPPPRTRPFQAAPSVQCICSLWAALLSQHLYLSSLPLHTVPPVALNAGRETCFSKPVACSPCICNPPPLPGEGGLHCQSQSSSAHSVAQMVLCAGPEEPVDLSSVFQDYIISSNPVLKQKHTSRSVRKLCVQFSHRRPVHPPPSFRNRVWLVPLQTSGCPPPPSRMSSCF